MLAVLKWSCAAVNRFWRTIYGSWMWFPRDVATQVLSDGWAFLESWNTNLDRTNFKLAQADNKFCLNEKFEPDKFEHGVILLFTQWSLTS